MRNVASSATLGARRSVLEHERPVGVRMTARALGVFESAEMTACLCAVRIMAGGTVDRPLGQSVVLTELELGEHILMTPVTTGRTRPQAVEPSQIEPIRPRVVHGVAVVTRHTGLMMGITRGGRTDICMAGLTRCRPNMCWLMIKCQDRAFHTRSAGVVLTPHVAGLAADLGMFPSCHGGDLIPVTLDTRAIRGREGAAKDGAEKKADNGTN